MLKFIIAFERPKTMSRDACHKYLRFSHGPRVASIPEFARHVRRYVQNYALPETEALGKPRLVADGAAELWFDDADSFVRAYSEPRYLEHIRPDESNFTNPGRYVATFTRETPIWEGGASTEIKMIRFLAITAGVQAQAAKQAWRDKHAMALAADRVARSLVSRYIQNWSIPSSENPFPLAEPFEGVDEFWFRSTDDVAQFVIAEQRILAADPTAPSMDLGASIAFMATEAVMPGYEAA
jgi:hypothetical protein